MRRRTVALLVAGRASYRLAQYGGGFVLLAIWGTQEFARYAGAVGLAGWLFSVSASGVERAALIGVGAPGGHRLERLFACLGAVPFALALAGWLAAAAAGAGPQVTIDLAAASLATGAGFATVLVGLFRVRGRPYPDVVAYLILSLMYVVVVGLAAWAGLGASALLAWLVAGVAAIDAVLWLRLRPGPTWPARSDLVTALRMTVSLAAGEVLGLVAVSVLFAELAARAPAAAISTFYVCMLIAAVAIALWPYLLRLAQPRISAWVTARPDEARRRIARMVTVVALPGAVLTAAGAVAVRSAGSPPVLVAFALAAEVAAMIGVATAAFLIEAIDDRTRAVSALGAVVGLAVVAGVGAWLIPSGPVAGALIALCAGWTARCPFLLVAARAPEPIAEPVTASPAPP